MTAVQTKPKAYVRENFDEPSVHVNLYIPEGMAEQVAEYRQGNNKSAAYRRVLEAGLKALSTNE